MRRSASEIIRNLEMRIARLERQADNGPSMVLTRSVVNELDKGADTDWLSAKIGSTKACKGGYCYYVSDEGWPQYAIVFEDVRGNQNIVIQGDDDVCDEVFDRMTTGEELNAPKSSRVRMDPRRSPFYQGRK